MKNLTSKMYCEKEYQGMVTITMAQCPDLHSFIYNQIHFQLNIRHDLQHWQIAARELGEVT